MSNEGPAAGRLKEEDAWLAEGELLSAATVASKVGKSLRTVQGWFEREPRGLPCETQIRRGQPCRVTTEHAVRMWARREGIVLGREKPAKDSPEAAPLVHAAEEARALSEAAFEKRVQEEVEKRLEDYLGDPDYDVRIVRFRKVLAQMFRVPETQVFEAAEAAQASTALKNASGELRQLEDAAMERRARRAELLEQSAVAKTISGMTDIMNGRRDAAPPKVGQAVGAALEPVLADAVLAFNAMVAEGKPAQLPPAEEFARAAAAVTERVIGEIFAEMAEAIAAMHRTQTPAPENARPATTGAAA